MEVSGHNQQKGAWVKKKKKQIQTLYSQTPKT